MRERTRTFLVVILLSPLVCAGASQTPQPTQGKASTSPPPIWTEAERKATLAKAQQGDRGAQKWLGTAYEQGWLGKRNFHQALGSGEPPHRAIPMLKPAWGKCTRMVSA